MINHRFRKLNIYPVITFMPHIRVDFNVHTEERLTFEITSAETQNCLWLSRVGLRNLDSCRPTYLRSHSAFAFS